MYYLYICESRRGNKNVRMCVWTNISRKGLMENWLIVPSLAGERGGTQSWNIHSWPLMLWGQCDQFPVVHDGQHRVQPILVYRSATLFMQFLWTEGTSNVSVVLICMKIGPVNKKKKLKKKHFSENQSSSSGLSGAFLDGLWRPVLRLAPLLSRLKMSEIWVWEACLSNVLQFSLRVGCNTRVFTMAREKPSLRSAVDCDSPEQRWKTDK